MANGKEGKKPGELCPFLGRKCAQDKCGLWARLELITESDVAPDRKKKVHLEGCPFKVSLVLIQFMLNSGASKQVGRRG